MSICVFISACQAHLPYACACLLASGVVNVVTLQGYNYINVDELIDITESVCKGA